MDVNGKVIQPLLLNWRTFFTRLFFLTAGSLVGAVSVIIFFAPSNIAPAGISGIGVILNELIGSPIGIVVLIGNLPILYLAYRMLGGLQAVIWTAYVVIVYSLVLDVLTPFFPPEGVSDDVMLNAIFAGVVNGVGGGLVLRGGGTYGGTATLARIIQIKFGTPLSSTYLYANIIIVVAAGVFLGWESALFSLVALIIEGMTSDYMLEGPAVIRTATIITDEPRIVADAILYQMQRGVTAWDATGMYTNQTRSILFVTLPRPQVSTLQQVVLTADPAAFIVIGQGHVAYGGDFKRSAPRAKV
jgi:uncharacterized membrane-anchored protein YitT (DUF2179 family)